MMADRPSSAHQPGSFKAADALDLAGIGVFENVVAEHIIKLVVFVRVAANITALGVDASIAQLVVFHGDLATVHLIVNVRRVRRCRGLVRGAFEHCRRDEWSVFGTLGLGRWHGLFAAKS